jgi:hypothetical protein
MVTVWYLWRRPMAIYCPQTKALADQPTAGRALASAPTSGRTAPARPWELAANARNCSAAGHGSVQVRNGASLMARSNAP